VDQENAGRAGRVVHKGAVGAAVLHLLPFAWDSFGSKAAAVGAGAAEADDVAAVLVAAAHVVAVDPRLLSKVAP